MVNSLKTALNLSTNHCNGYGSTSLQLRTPNVRFYKCKYKKWNVIEIVKAQTFDWKYSPPTEVWQNQSVNFSLSVIHLSHFLLPKVKMLDWRLDVISKLCVMLIMALYSDFSRPNPGASSHLLPLHFIQSKYWLFQLYSEMFTEFLNGKVDHMTIACGTKNNKCDVNFFNFDFDLKNQ